ncbi:hypothetical protein P43SY_005803 [Pythium insidiosum]|uniref:protein-tyrosine-phosphatase n=1 Tax=Pythium insidiosum TaxID=114742 RepID=A0AAD5MBS0_PYTIN|nr:hypothetical protein P43SY_005803 [Pythium insidiosum]
MPPAWSSLPDEEDARIPMDAEDEISTSSSSNSNRSARSRSLTLSLPRLRGPSFKRPRIKRPSVPALSATSLFNRLQTSSVVVIDCRSAGDFAAAHVHNALLCENGRTGVGNGLKTVDDVIAARHNDALARKLADRDMLEVVVIGSNRPKPVLLRRMDGGYRFAKMLQAEGRVFSVRFLATGFHEFARKYPFMLRSGLSTVASSSSHTAPLTSSMLSSSSSSVRMSTSSVVKEEPAPATPPVLQYPNEIVDDFLYLGNFWQADNAQIVRDLQITHIINMGAITESRQQFDGVQYLDVDIKDKVDVDIRVAFTPTIEFIQRAAQTPGSRVLIHCVQGVSRSSTIVIWYLMLETKCTLSAAYSYVLKRRPLIFPNRGFMEQLLANERSLYGTESVLPQELDLLQHGLLPPTDRKGSALRPSLSM